MNFIRKEIVCFVACLSCMFCISCISLYAKSKKTENYSGSKDKLHLYLLIGQSNMAGRAAFSKKEADIVPRCYLFNGEDKWEPAKNPFNRYSTIMKSLKMQKMNPGYSFATTMLKKKKKDISIGLVVNARGGTSIREWKKGSKYYKEALKQIKKAQKTGTLKGILWHQGEGDREDDKYLEKLKALVADLRKDLKEPKLPFVAGQVNDVKLINDQIAKLPKTVPFTGFVSSKGLKATDRWHFDAKSMKLLGQRYAEEILKIEKKSK